MMNHILAIILRWGWGCKKSVPIDMKIFMPKVRRHAVAAGKLCIGLMSGVLKLYTREQINTFSMRSGSVKNAHNSSVECPKLAICAF